jgi:membrane protease YdiL (CAAX protease family)
MISASADRTTPDRHAPTTDDGAHTRGTPPWVRYVRRHPLACFFVLAYVLSWSYWLPLAFTGQIVMPGSGNPTHFPGLLGPALAALAITAVTQGRGGLRDLGRRMVRWRVGWRWYGAVAVPLGFFTIAITANALAGNGWPHPADLARYSGLPSVGLLAVYLLALMVNGFGEETGWRGFALPHLQRRYRPLNASLLLAIGWAGWHLPLFFIVDSFRTFSAATLPGFLIGLACGAILLTYVYNGTGGSILIVALWHITYNMTTATVAGKGMIAAVVSTLVILWAVVLVIGDLTATRRGRPSPLRIRTPEPIRPGPGQSTR